MGNSTELKYEEKQFFGKTIAFKVLFLLVILAFGGTALLSDFSGDTNFVGMALIGASMVLVLLMLKFMTLHTRVQEDTLKIDLFMGIHFRENIPFKEIKLLEKVRYNPFRTGYGLRYSFVYGKIFNISGHDGVQIELNSGKRIMLGSQESEQLYTILKEKKASSQNN